MSDIFQANEETFTGELRFIETFLIDGYVTAGSRILQQKVRVRYEFNKYREEWRDVPIVKEK